MTDWKGKKLWIDKETGQVNTQKKIYICWKLQALNVKKFKTTAGRKKLKTVEYITPTMDHYPRNV